MQISRKGSLKPHPKHYVYIHFHPQRPDDVRAVVYVGEGTDGRAWSRRERSTEHSHWMRDWQNLGFAPDEYVKVVRRRLTKEEALKQEADLIQYHLKKGCSLFNDTGVLPEQKRPYKPLYPDVVRRRPPK